MRRRWHKGCVFGCGTDGDSGAPDLLLQTSRSGKEWINPDFRKENVVDSILCKESNKCLFYNTFKHMIQSATKNKSWKT